MTPDQPSGSARPLPGGQSLKNALRRVFDAQIPNYGDYNLVFAVQQAQPLHPEQSEQQQSLDEAVSGARTPGYVVGYRWKPAELMIAPVDLTAITGAGVPVEVNMTNLAHAVQWEDDGTYEVGTSTGRIFRFGVSAEPVLDVGPGNPLRLVQKDDLIDFRAFMDAFIGMA